MGYYSLRITLGELFNVEDVALTEQHRRRVKYLIKDLIREKVAKDTNYVLGMEKKDKYGDDTKYHYHFNFESDDSKDTLRKWIVRKSEKSDMKLKGNKVYCLQQHTEPEDYDRWFRYCLKEKHSKSILRYDPGEEGKTLEDLILLAKDERERSQKANREQRDKINEKRTYYDKIVEMLDTLGVKSRKDIYISICKKYVDDGKPCNPLTVRGYTNTYMLGRKLISFEAFYEMNEN